VCAYNKFINNIKVIRKESCETLSKDTCTALMILYSRQTVMYVYRACCRLRHGLNVPFRHRPGRNDVPSDPSDLNHSLQYTTTAVQQTLCTASFWLRRPWSETTPNREGRGVGLGCDNITWKNDFAHCLIILFLSRFVKLGWLRYTYIHNINKRFFVCPP